MSESQGLLTREQTPTGTFPSANASADEEAPDCVEPTLQYIDGFVDVGDLYDRHKEDEERRGTWNTVKDAIFGSMDGLGNFKNEAVTKKADKASQSFFKRFWRILKLGFRHKCCSASGFILLFTAFANLLSAALSAFLPGLVGRLSCLISCTCGGAPEGKLQADALRTTIFVAVMLVIILVVVGVLNVWAGLHLAIRTRLAIVEHLHDRYFRHRNYYKISNLDDRVDNADQRITQDVNALTATMFGGVSPKIDPLIFGQSSLFGTILMAFFLTFIVLQTSGSQGVLICYGWFLLAMIVQGVLVRTLSVFVFRQEQCEGDFRFVHVRLRTNAESVAFYNGEEKEKHAVGLQLIKVTDNQRRLANKQNYVLVANSFFSSFGTLFTYLVPAIAVLGANDCLYTVEDLSTTVMATAQLMATLSILPGKGASFATLMGYVNRVGQLLEILDELDDSVEAAGQATMGVGDGATVALRHVQLVTPMKDNRQLVLQKDLNLEVTPGMSIVVMGPSGVGKSSLLRVLGGLWPVPQGEIIRPHNIGRGGIFFVPQRPYIVLGTLRSNLIYPHEVRESTTTDNELLDILNTVGLSYIAERFSLDHVAVWEDILSGGEAQRLGFARLLVHRPQFAVMDESTSALDTATERRCMEAAVAADITMISVAHRESVIKYHQYRLDLSNDNGGSSKLSKLDE